MSTPLRPSPLSFDNSTSTSSGRQSPFKRQNSASPATVRASTPPISTTSPTKPSNASLSPTKAGSLSPEKTSPFVRRPSQINTNAERPTSPFARPSSSLSINAGAVSPTRQGGKNEDTPPASPRFGRAASVTPAPEDEDIPTPSRLAASPSPFDGPASPPPATESPSAPQFPSQANLRPTAPRTKSSTSTATASTIRPPNFRGNTIAMAMAVAPAQPTHHATGNRGYNHIPPPLLRSMRESFEVLDASNSGAITSASVAGMLEQMGLPSNPSDVRDFFPSDAPAQLNLARYLDTLSGPMSQLSQPEELVAAFGAFDTDDSGQIDVAELRKALLDSAPEPGEEKIRLGERELDGILSEFAGRRAFGAKGLSAANGKGEVFRYRDFMGSISGGGGGQEVEQAVVA